MCWAYSLVGSYTPIQSLTQTKIYFDLGRLLLHSRPRSGVCKRTELICLAGIKARIGGTISFCKCAGARMMVQVLRHLLAMSLSREAEGLFLHLRYQFQMSHLPRQALLKVSLGHQKYILPRDWIHTSATLDSQDTAASEETPKAGAYQQPKVRLDGESSTADLQTGVEGTQARNDCLCRVQSL